MNTDRKTHWENVYKSKQPHEVSWTQKLPQTSLKFIKEFNLPKSASIIDIGGGDSQLADFLLDAGYTDITVLDISESALERAKQRLGDKAQKINWIVADVTEFKPQRNYDCWHDRAAFHFLTTVSEIDKYLKVSKQHVNNCMIFGTFSETGPEKCSMLPVHRYSEKELSEKIENGFKKIKCIREDHTTPFGTTQNFLFCSFKRKQ